MRNYGKKKRNKEKKENGYSRIHGALHEGWLFLISSSSSSIYIYIKGTGLSPFKELLRPANKLTTPVFLSLIHSSIAGRPDKEKKNS